MRALMVDDKRATSRARPPTFYTAKVGRAVRYLREVAGISLTEMAAAVHLTVSGWSRVETGRTTMTVDQLERAAKAIGKKPSEILAFVEAAP